jgi:hypothetical protein
MIYTPHQILLGLSTEGEQCESGRWHTWGKRQIIQDTGWQNLKYRDH